MDWFLLKRASNHTLVGLTLKDWTSVTYKVGAPFLLFGPHVETVDQ
jgi:hypothetical protein